MPAAIRLAVFGLAAAMATAACVSSRRDMPISVCDVLAAPEIFDGKTVSIRGVIRTDYFEFSGVGDAGCPRRVISLGPENHVRSGLDELERWLQQIRHSPDARLEVTIDGVIDHRPGQVPFLLIDEMYFSDFEVVPWAEPALP